MKPQLIVFAQLSHALYPTVVKTYDLREAINLMTVMRDPTLYRALFSAGGTLDPVSLEYLRNEMSLRIGLDVRSAFRIYRGSIPAVQADLFKATRSSSKLSTSEVVTLSLARVSYPFEEEFRSLSLDF